MFGGCSTPKATQLMQNNLRIIERKINHDTTLNLGAVEPAIIFLEKTTSIRSESNGNYIGRYEPTRNDYQHWSNWFEKNKSKIYFDKTNNKIQLK